MHYTLWSNSLWQLQQSQPNHHIPTTYTLNGAIFDRLAILSYQCLYKLYMDKPTLLRKICIYDCKTLLLCSCFFLRSSCTTCAIELHVPTSYYVLLSLFFSFHSMK